MGVRAAMYKKGIKPLLFNLHPDTAHSLVLGGLSMAGSMPGAARVVELAATRQRPMLQQTWRGMQFNSPVGLSAGLDKNGKAVPMMKALGFGFAEVGSVTAEPCAGNARPWFYRLPKTQSLVVHVGLANEGVEAIAGRLEKLPRTLQAAYPKVLSIARTNNKQAAGVETGIADYVASARRAKHSPAVQMIELNISCPNAYGGQTYTTPLLLEKLLAAIDEVKLGKPILVKLPIDLPWSKLSALLDVIIVHDIAGVTISNLTKRRTASELKDPLPDAILGGLSGAPLRARSTELIRKTYRAYGNRLTIFGVGGILSPEDAYEKIKAGATFVELITGLIMNGPQFVDEVNRGLVRLLKADGYGNILEAVGADCTR